MKTTTPDKWAQLRFAVIGPLLVSPPERGTLQAEFERLSKKTWKHPTSGQEVRFSASTIERWYYAARRGSNPVSQLRRRSRRDRGRRKTINGKLAQAIRAQHSDHPTWSYQLHLDNLAVLAEEDPELGPMPSYSSLRRHMVAKGLVKKRRKKRLKDGEICAQKHRESREQRSFEVEYVNGLWHLDFHHCSRKILTAKGEWVRPILLAVIDDHSRLVCHAQWYLQETAECLVHGFTQALCKRGLPRGLMTDNGSAMVSTEFVQGLARLSIHHQPTLPYSPQQNAKQEVFFAQVEGRFMAMLEGEPEIALKTLNQATLAWVEMEYQRKVHSETGQQPITRWLDGRSVGRPCPSLDKLRLAFTAAETRTQRQSDGTISLEGVRFEVPARFGHLRKIQLRYASWDLGHVFMMDEHAEVVLHKLYPLDKARNADGFRPPTRQPPAMENPDSTGIAPLLRKLMRDYAATGMPPAYIAKENS
jgi:transposase InsO family protein